MQTDPVTLFTAITRGVCNRCPKCGEGKLLASFITPVAQCSVCHEPLNNIRADDGPPWLTILIVGHIMLPLIFSYGPSNDWPLWLAMSVCIAMAVALMVLILPRAKGFFIGAIWKNRQMNHPSNPA